MAFKAPDNISFHLNAVVLFVFSLIPYSKVFLNAVIIFFDIVNDDGMPLFVVFTLLEL